MLSGLSGKNKYNRFESILSAAKLTVIWNRMCVSTQTFAILGLKSNKYYEYFPPFEVVGRAVFLALKKIGVKQYEDSDSRPGVGVSTLAAAAASIPVNATESRRNSRWFFQRRL